MGKDMVFSMDAQIDFLVSEIKRDSKLLSALKSSSKSLESLSDMVLVRYERPGVVVNNKISKNAVLILTQLTDKRLSEEVSRRRQQSKTAYGFIK